MKIICKELKGDEVVLEVSENTKIADVKKDIESKLGVPGKSRLNRDEFSKLKFTFSLPAKVALPRKDPARHICR